MAEAADVFDDNLNDCFEPRADAPSYTEVTLRSVSNVEANYQALSGISTSVGSPEKYSTFRETFVRYLVKSQSSREEFMNQVYEVFRRYNDFLWLRDRLEETNPTLVIPPFPPKHSVNSVDRFNGPFIIARCQALDRFLTRVCYHPVLSSTDDLFHFLTISEDAAWQHYKKSHNVNGHYWEKMKSLVQNGESCAEFEDVTPKLELCRNACGHMINTARLMNGEEKNLTREMTELAAHVSRWSSESGYIPKIGSELYLIGQCCRFHVINNPFSLLDKLKTVYEAHCNDLPVVSDCIQTTLIPELNDLIAYSECVKKVVARRDRLQGTISDNADAAESLEKSMDTPSTLSRKIRGESVFEERNRRESRLSAIRARADSLSRNLENSNTDLKLELGRWEEHRHKATRRTLIAFAAQRVAHHRRLDEHWGRLLEDLNVSIVGNGSN